MDELHGILTTYEMRNSSENPSRKEATHKAAHRDKKKLKLESTIMKIQNKMCKKLTLSKI